jgi:DNA-binding SARP family transcriptional activator
MTCAITWHTSMSSSTLSCTQSNWVQERAKALEAEYAKALEAQYAKALIAEYAKALEADY